MIVNAYIAEGTCARFCWRRALAIFNQLSGVNIVLLYMLDILSSAGVGLDLGHTYTVMISCLSLATTALGMAYVDRAGRKPLLYVGSVGRAVCLLCLAVAIPGQFVPLAYLCILVACNAFFAFSQGTVVWVYLSELFPAGIRGAGQGYGSFVHWIVNAMLVSAFPVMQHASFVRIFYVFALMMVLQAGVIWRWYPETRGTTLGSLAAAERIMNELDECSMTRLAETAITKSDVPTLVDVAREADVSLKTASRVLNISKTSAKKKSLECERQWSASATARTSFHAV